MSTLHDADNDAMFGRDLRVYPPKPNPMSEHTAAPAEHPSVAWWAACPWITDRLPTAADADARGLVLKWTERNPSGFRIENWKLVTKYDLKWVHTSRWRPPALTLGQRIDAELAAKIGLAPELRAILIEAKSVVGEVVK